jgi:hypothetical protein
MSQASIKEHLDRISKELSQIKKLLIDQWIIDQKKVNVNWEDFLNMSKEISKKWKGPSAVDEVRQQREKRS